MGGTTKDSGADKNSQAGRIQICGNCGRQFRRDEPLGRSMSFCCRKCFAAARQSGKFRPTNKIKTPGQIPHEKVYIRITQEIDVWDEFKPVVGSVYLAEKYENQKLPGYVVTVNGNRVCVRYGECEEVEHE